MTSSVAYDKQLENKQIQPTDSEEKWEGIFGADVKESHISATFGCDFKSVNQIKNESLTQRAVNNAFQLKHQSIFPTNRLQKEKPVYQVLRCELRIIHQCNLSVEKSIKSNRYRERIFEEADQIDRILEPNEDNILSWLVKKIKKDREVCIVPHFKERSGSLKG